MYEHLIVFYFRNNGEAYDLYNKKNDEDLDFGCEERAEGAPVMAVVTLMNSSDEELRVKAEYAMLYERNINEGDKVCFDEGNHLEKNTRED